MTNANDDQRPATPGHDRRAFLQRAGLGAVAVGAWVAPQVLFTDVASAGCTPITRLLQISALSCGGVSPTTFSTFLPGCAPAGWVAGRTDGVPFSCVAPFGLLGAIVTVNLAGCGPTEARAVRFCPNASPGPTYNCVSGTIVGNIVTFPTIAITTGCLYVDYRITVTCCT